MKNHQKSTAHRFFLQNLAVPESISVDSSFILDDSEPTIMHQMTKVFRCKIGDKIVLLNQNNQSQSNYEFYFEMVDFDKRHLKLMLQKKLLNSNELSVKLELAIGMPNKPAKLDYILEKAVELGVCKIHLIKTELSQFAHQIKGERLQKILIEAAEQSERAIVPTAFDYPSLQAFFNEQSNIKDSAKILVALERSPEVPNILDISQNSNSIILVGPEGGFSPNEVKLMQDLNLQAFNLGGTILKMETACVLALGIFAISSSKNS